MKILRHKLLHIAFATLFLTLGFIVFTCSTGFAAANPAIFFSDLDWGPKTGWEGSATTGAAITIWGKNFGSSRGTSYVTVNGAQLTSDSDYAEWGVTGTANGIPRGLERTTFWLKNTCADGAGTISVTIGGVTSNTIPFLVAAGTIYFISVSDGSNSYNGLYSTRTGHTGSDGPFKDILKFNPANNPSGDGQYICYVRGGTYTNQDADSAFIALRGPYGSSSHRKGLIGYPTEVPTLNTALATRGIVWNADYSPYGLNSYFTYAKLHGINGESALESLGLYNRIIGNHLQDYLDNAWTGVVWATASQYTQILGNYFNHIGYDSYKHNIYLKAQAGVTADRSVQNIYVGWNEINNPVAGADNRGGAIFISRNSDAGAYVTHNIFIHDNYFHDGNMEFIYEGDNTNIGDVYIYNNIFKGGTNTNGGAISFAGGTNNVYLYNNIFYQTGNGMGALFSGFDTGGPLNSRIYSKNNIYYANNGVAYLSWDGASKGAQYFSDHDLFYNPDNGSSTAPAGSGLTVTNSIMNQNPQFATAGTDFHLLTTSPAKDAGITAQYVGTQVIADFEGVSRPQNSVIDIGPYEY